MIISSQPARDTKVGTRAYFEKDSIVAYHTEDLTDLLRNNYELRKDDNNGWTKDRNFRLIGQLSELGDMSVRAHHPEVNALDASIQNRAWHKAFQCDQCKNFFTVRKGV